MTDPIERLNAALDGRYRIERELGEGGMATVYLAEDLRHERHVALKVLKPELSAVVGADRFLAEIKTTANLQHPHILPLFDSGEADGFLFYVMPSVEGESLRDRLVREGQLPVEEAVRLASAVANALQAAHDKGVIHRDIKPANILLSGGEPLVADFGIALAVGVAGGGRLTATGLSVGTPNYMSPEQAMGGPHVGPASDTFSLGCVLYEMLVGGPPFEAKTPQAVLGKIVSAEWESISGQRSTVPRHVEAVVAKCLERVPADRFASTRDMAEALADSSFRHGEVAGGRPSGVSPGWRVAALVLAGVAAVSAWMAGGRAETPAPVVQYVESFPAGEELSDVVGTTIALSPDGNRLVYAGPGNQLWVRERSRLSGEPIPGTEGGIKPFFSPDGQSIAFISEGLEIKVASFTGEPPRTLVPGDVFNVGAAWGNDGYVYFTTQAHLGILRIPADGTAGAEPITSLDGSRREVYHGWPDPLPDGGVVFSISRAGGNPADIAVFDAEAGETRILVQGWVAKYAHSGDLVFVLSDGTLAAAPFDADRKVLVGASTLVESGVGAGFDRGVPFDLSDNGRLMYLSGAATISRQVVWVDREGVAQPIDPDWFGGVYPRVSPDGNRLAFSDGGQIWIKDLVTGDLAQLTFEAEGNTWPAWTRDGRHVMYGSGDRDLFRRRADGSVGAELVLDHDRDVAQGIQSPEADWYVFRFGTVQGERDLYAMSTGSGAIRELVAADANERAPDLSPNGRWLVYVSDESGRDEVYVRPFPDTEDRVWKVSQAGGIDPVWANNGRELFYLDRTNQLVSVSVTTDPDFLLGPQVDLFSMSPYGRDPNHTHYDVSPDDQRFVMVRTQRSGGGQLVVVENFFEELRRLAPR